MTATQAPTPGPLSVGNLHTAIMEALAEDIQRQRPDAFREEDENGFEGDVIIPTGATPHSAFAKVNVSDLAEVILPLVAPTAPVEASGSERDGYVTAFYDIAKMLGIGARAWSPAETWHREMRPKLEAALRPQPSGETREALAIAQAEYDHWIKEALKHKRPKGLRSDCENRDLERARIAKRILDKIATHPSPTPAADDDRVREAFDAGVDVGYRDITGRDAPQAFKDKKWPEALAALKSTAAKEGVE